MKELFEFLSLPIIVSTITFLTQFFATSFVNKRESKQKEINSEKEIISSKTESIQQETTRVLLKTSRDFDIVSSELTDLIISIISPLETNVDYSSEDFYNEIQKTSLVVEKIEKLITEINYISTYYFEDGPSYNYLKKILISLNDIVKFLFSANVDLTELESTYYSNSNPPSVVTEPSIVRSELESLRDHIQLESIKCMHHFRKSIFEALQYFNKFKIE